MGCPYPHADRPLAIGCHADLPPSPARVHSADDNATASSQPSPAHIPPSPPHLRCCHLSLPPLCLPGIPLRDMVASCAVGHLSGHALLDLNYMEDSGGGPDIAVALHPSSGKMVLLQMDSRLPIEK